MHLAFLSLYDPDDVRAWSGIPHFVARALRAHPGVERLSVVGPLDLGDRVRGRVEKLRQRARGGGYLRSHTEGGAAGLSEQAEAACRRLRPDAVLALSSLPFFAFAPGVPSASWADATFEANLLFYPHDFSTLADGLIAEAHRVERAALHNVGHALFAAGFAADSARGYYGVPAERVGVVPFGANLDDVPPRPDVERAVAGRDTDRCRLLFLGGDWYRKGGDVAVRVVEELRRGGVEAELVVAGTRAPTEHPAVRSVGFLRKDVPAERERLRALLSESHFLCMPVRAEDYGCVFPEAGAFGVPSVTTDAGGAADAVGAGGLVVRARTSPQEIAARVANTLADPAAYRALALAARDRFEAVTNWETATDAVVARLGGAGR